MCDSLILLRRLLLNPSAEHNEIITSTAAGIRMVAYDCRLHLGRGIPPMGGGCKGGGYICWRF